GPCVQTDRARRCPCSCPLVFQPPIFASRPRRQRPNPELTNLHCKNRDDGAACSKLTPNMKIKLKQSSKILSEGPDRDEDIDDLDEALEVIPFTFTITAYGADYPVDSIVKRIEANDIIVPRFNWEDPGSEIVGFQREYVWPRKKADRFIESLLLGLPVPGIFLVKENSGRFLVLDGHQRLFSLHAYYQGIIDKEEYRLEDVQDRFRGKRYRDLDIEDR